MYVCRLKGHFINFLPCNSPAMTRHKRSHTESLLSLLLPPLFLKARHSPVPRFSSELCPISDFQLSPPLLVVV